MFRLIELNFDDQSYLGHIPADQLVFVPQEERELTKIPYTSVLIGANGTGKSTILSYIVKIFEDIKYFKDTGKRAPRAITFSYNIKYQIDTDVFKFTQKNKGLDLDAYKQGNRTLKWYYEVSINDKPIEEIANRIFLPDNIVAVSYLPMDRFRQKNNAPEDFYLYLGLRHRSNAASTQFFLNNTLPLLFRYISESRSVNFLKNILVFMGMDQDYLGIQLEYRYKKSFFSGKLTAGEFENLMNDPEKFSKRSTTSFGSEYYSSHVKGNEQLISRLAKYLNNRTSKDHIVTGERSLLEFNLFENIELVEELSLIYHLQKLDLLSSANLLFRKGRGMIVNSEQLSSGEFHFLSTMIAIQASIKPKSLVLIDEPETSLHPNWQISYVENLKLLFKKWSTIHFVIATHSHFMISDLDNASSEVIGLKGQVPNIHAKAFNKKTFGLSAEEVLLEIFQVPTTRNYYVYEKVGEILELIALRDTSETVVRKDRVLTDIQEKIKQLQERGIDRLSKEDPLKEVVDKLIKKYGRLK